MEGAALFLGPVRSGRLSVSVPLAGMINSRVHHLTPSAAAVEVVVEDLERLVSGGRGGVAQPAFELGFFGVGPGRRGLVRAGRP